MELKGCADRAAAQAYLAVEETPAPPVLEGPGRPAVVPPAPEHRVSGLIPFVHVEDGTPGPRQQMQLTDPDGFMS